MSIKAVSETLALAEQTTDWISPFNDNPWNNLDISIEADSAWSGTIQLQKSRDGGSTVHVVKEYTEDSQEYVEDKVPGVVYRLYCSARSAGAALCELYKEG
jgi:hypothetical protein